MPSMLTRRSLLAAGLAGTAVAGRAVAAPLPGPFAHGVASGDPLADRVILWTRVTTAAAGDAAVRYVLATDPGLTSIVRTADTVAVAERDHTVKVDVVGLTPFTTYYYAFELVGTGERSIVGRTKTAPGPTTPVQRLRIGVTSCGQYEAGFFNAYARLADHDLDLVVHLGDYVYEYGGSSDPNNPMAPPPGSALGRVVEPRVEMTTLDLYRRRHAFYKTDPDLRRIHQQHPMVCIWDDHESSNNTWFGGANNHSRDGSDPNEPKGDDGKGLEPFDEGDWFQRKAMAQRAYDEWLPIRLPVAGDPATIYRRIPLGALADLVMLDTRLEGRSKQVDGASGEAFAIQRELDDPARQLYSQTQRTFLEQALTGSTATWKLLGNQVLMSQVKVATTGLSPEMLEPLRQFGAISFGGVTLIPDVWDGYTAERSRLFDHIKTMGVENVVVLTGDIHSAWANDLYENPFLDPIANPALGDKHVGVEFVVSSVTSGNFDEIFRSRPVSQAFQQYVKVQNPGTKYLEGDDNGYYVLDITAQRVQADFWSVDRIDRRVPGQAFRAGWETRVGANPLHEVTRNGPTGPRTGAPAPAPPVADPDPVVPEVALPALLPVAGLAVLGATAGVVARRRRVADNPSL